MKNLLVALYQGWMVFARAMGRVQTFLILSIIYFVAIGIIAPFLRLFAGDPLDRRIGDRDSIWVPRARSNLRLEESRHLF